MVPLGLVTDMKAIFCKGMKTKRGTTTLQTQQRVLRSTVADKRYEPFAHSFQEIGELHQIVPEQDGKGAGFRGETGLGKSCISSPLSPSLGQTGKDGICSIRGPRNGCFTKKHTGASAGALNRQTGRCSSIGFEKHADRDDFHDRCAPPGASLNAWISLALKRERRNSLSGELPDSVNGIHGS